MIVCPPDTVKTVIMVIVAVTVDTKHHNGQRPADTQQLASPCITPHLVTTLLVSYAVTTSTLRAN